MSVVERFENRETSSDRMDNFPLTGHGPILMLAPTPGVAHFSSHHRRQDGALVKAFGRRRAGSAESTVRSANRPKL
jgi:hypothetical protein